MRISSYAAVTGIAVMIGVYEGSMVGSLPVIFTYLHPVLPMLVMFFLLKRPQAAYITAGVSGVVVDLISATPTGFATARWLLVAFVIDLIAENIITNRSMYGSWVLVFLARLSELLIIFITYFFYKYLLERIFILQNYDVYFYSIVIDLVLTSVLFLGTTLFTKRFLTFIPFMKGRYG
ncbi:MAG: hypothetical protein P1P90_02720 [Patescibacteria group bacterium]|nr:hypothetical protein [Patescibacteria group bacterium]